MHDAVAMLSRPAREAYERGELADIVYADDTLLLGSCSKHVEELLRAVAFSGRAYGLELHQGKFQLLQVRCASTVRNLSLDSIPSTPSLVYLGATLAADGRVGSELSRRIGMAKGDFRALSKVWRHSSLLRARKLEIYRALIESRLLYGLSTACFTKAQLRQLDGFQAKCLRSILGIPPSFVSRVSNACVRQQAECKSSSSLLRERQVSFVGKVLRAGSDSPLRKVSFSPGSLQPATSRYVRRVGRPQQEWIPNVLPHAFQAAGGAQHLEAAAQNQLQWKRLSKHVV